jgi:hypothetical protein
MMPTREVEEGEVMSKVLFCPCSNNREIFNGRFLLPSSDTPWDILFPAEENKQEEYEWHNSSSLVYILQYKNSL